MDENKCHLIHVNYQNFNVFNCIFNKVFMPFSAFTFLKKAFMTDKYKRGIVILYKRSEYKTPLVF